jgi:hypothetical protein
VRSKQLDARFEPVLMNKSKEHLMIPDRTPTQTQPSPALVTRQLNARCVLLWQLETVMPTFSWCGLYIRCACVSMLRGRGFLSGRGCICLVRGGG